MDRSGGYHPQWGNPITKEAITYALTYKWILVQKIRILKIQFAKHNKIKKEDQCVDTSFLLRIGNKIPTEGITETTFGAKMKGWTIQRLPHLEIHPIISHQTQTLLHMPARFCWKDLDIALSCEAHSGEARESTQGAEGVCNPIDGTTIWTNQYPQSSCLKLHM